MTIDVPKEWESLWADYDRMFLRLVELFKQTDSRGERRGVSRSDIGLLFSAVSGTPPRSTPSWNAWAAVRINAGDYRQVWDAVKAKTENG